MKLMRLVACIALCATLFSGVSPTLAALLYSGNPEVLGQILGVPPASRPTDEAPSDLAHHAADHGAPVENTIEHGALVGHTSDHAAPANGTSEHGIPVENTSGHGDSAPAHEAHAIHCAFCLPGSSIAAVFMAPPSTALLELGFHVAEPPPPILRFSSFFPQYRSRAPPIAS